MSEKEGTVTIPIEEFDRLRDVEKKYKDFKKYEKDTTSFLASFFDKLNNKKANGIDNSGNYTGIDLNIYTEFSIRVNGGNIGNINELDYSKPIKDIKVNTYIESSPAIITSKSYYIIDIKQ